MGELIFCLGYGGSLIILGLITKICVKKMDQDLQHVSKTDIPNDEKVGM